MNVALHPPLNVLGICAGVGGLELGLQLAHGYLGKAVRGVCYVEREAAAAASLVASMEAGWLHPAPIWSDARTFGGTSWRGLVDIVTSGDPCQGNSVAGKRLGQLDDRWLLDRAIDIFDQTGADTFFRENVPGNADGQLAVAIPALERLGCRVAVGIFSSAETGNTMRRERLFILAKREGTGLSARRSRSRTGKDGEVFNQQLINGGADVAGLDGGLCGDRGIQRGGQLGFQPEGDGACREGNRCPAMGSPLGRGDGGQSQDPGRASGERIAVDRAGGSCVGTLVEPESIGPGEGWAEHAREQGRSAAALTSGPMDDAYDSGRWAQGHARDQAIFVDPAGGTRLPPAVIPGPADNAGWRAVLDRWPEYQPALSQEEAQSHLRRGIDAMANRIERLRATGNGVDPVVACHAWLSLSALLDAGAQQMEMF